MSKEEETVGVGATMIRPLLASVLTLAVVTGCASQNTGPGRRQVRLDSLKAYVTDRHDSLSADEFQGVEQVTYFVTYGVTKPKMPFLDPVVEEIAIARSDGKPPAMLCAVVGMKGAWESNVACLCEERTRSYGSVDFNTFILGWNEEEGKWQSIYSIASSRVVAAPE